MISRAHVAEIVTKSVDHQPLTGRDWAGLWRWQGEQHQRFLEWEADYRKGLGVPPATFEEESVVPEGSGCAFWATWTCVAGILAGIGALVAQRAGTVAGLAAILGMVLCIVALRNGRNGRS